MLDVCIPAIANDIGTSLRSLQYAFKETYGISPKRYLMAEKLNQARHMIIQNPKKTVTNHARTAGYWHMAQFSTDYKKLFGENPSETRIRSLRLKNNF